MTFALTGCPPKETAKEEPKVETPPQPTEFKKTGSPDMYFRAASLDLKSFPRKIEMKDIERFAARMKKEKIDILAVQTIVRYPDLKERIDVFEELGRKTEMYKIFGETIALSGRQIGNAVFSSYPIRSNDNVPYKNLKSTNLESAMVALVDAGTRPLLVVSTRIPDNASEREVLSCLKTIALQKKNFKDTPIAIFGNIIKPKKLQELEGVDEPLEYNILTWEKSKETKKIPLWFSSVELQPINSTIIETDLGLTLITEFKLAGQPAQ
ncbi:MAG: hypothetical protein EPO24_10505 [Bacteroidetes bacterium]|nr:MAG: hypothetical protein EPO24_10505 [Bacteroidota bacterium]